MTDMWCRGVWTLVASAQALPHDCICYLVCNQKLTYSRYQISRESSHIFATFNVHKFFLATSTTDVSALKSSLLPVNHFASKWKKIQFKITLSSPVFEPWRTDYIANVVTWLPHQCIAVIHRIQKLLHCRLEITCTYNAEFQVVQKKCEAAHVSCACISSTQAHRQTWVVPTFTRQYITISLSAWKTAVTNSSIKTQQTALLKLTVTINEIQNNWKMSFT